MLEGVREEQEQDVQEEDAVHAATGLLEKSNEQCTTRIIFIVVFESIGYLFVVKGKLWTYILF